MIRLQRTNLWSFAGNQLRCFTFSPPSYLLGSDFHSYLYLDTSLAHELQSIIRLGDEWEYKSLTKSDWTLAITVWLHLYENIAGNCLENSQQVCEHHVSHLLHALPRQHISSKTSHMWNVTCSDFILTSLSRRLNLIKLDNIRRWFFAVRDATLRVWHTLTPVRTHHTHIIQFTYVKQEMTDIQFLMETEEIHTQGHSY